MWASQKSTKTSSIFLIPGMMSRKSNSYEEDTAEGELRRGPWIVEEDSLLIQYINSHGEGRWNSLAKSAGLKRTGKSCRLRWLNYLKPDTKRGNLTPHEQLLILELHSKWGNRWSKIAQHLPGRTDNEIKNYWRTRVQKQARQLKVDSNSKKFLEVVRMFLMPRLKEKIEQTSSAMGTPKSATTLDDKLPLTNLKHMADNSFLVKRCDNSSTPSYDALDFGKIPAFEGDGCYHVPLPSYDMQELDLQNNLMSGDDLAELDWFREDLEVALWTSAI